MAEDHRRTVSFILDNIKVALPSLIIGAIVTYLIVDKVVIAGKDADIASYKTVIEVERGRLQNKEDQLKVAGDRAAYLVDKLKYKPEDQKIETETLTQENNQLKLEVATLRQIKEKFEAANEQKVNIAELETEIDSLRNKNQILEKDIARLRNPTVVQQVKVRKGESWSGLSGEIILGLNSIDSRSGEGYVASITTNMASDREIKVKAGSQIPFTVSDRNYILNIDAVHYIGDEIIISVYQRSIQ